jgi:hypothetical protein
MKLKYLFWKAHFVNKLATIAKHLFYALCDCHEKVFNEIEAFYE